MVDGMEHDGGRMPGEAAADAARLRAEGEILAALAQACGCKCFRPPLVEVWDDEFVNVTLYEGFCAASSVMNDWFLSADLADGIGIVPASGPRRGCGRHLKPSRRRDRGSGRGPAR